MKTPKVLVLDYTKWRCGYTGMHKLGTGYTRLLNEYGYMCCLGQFSAQHKIPDTKLLNKTMPARMEKSVGIFTETSTANIGGLVSKKYSNSQLTVELISINDDAYTTPAEKINLIRVELEKYGIKLKVINQPEENGNTENTNPGL